MHGTPPTHAEVRAAIAAELAALRDEGRLRVRPVIDSPNGRAVILHADGKRAKLINWASNDYLGAIGRLAVRNGAARALRTYGSGAGAARLLAGGLRCHRRLEERLANWLGCQDALVTTTGFQANLAALVALVGDPQDAIIADRNCHASIYDGAKLASVPLLRFRHNEVDDLARQLDRTEAARRRVVCIESVYSMDGDEAPLAAIAELCKARGALLVVDEAHAIGVFGAGGRGLCAELGVAVDLRVGTCSKALGAQGGFIAGDRDFIELIVNRGRGFIFSTAPVPAAMGAAVAALDLLRDHPELCGQLLAVAAELRDGLRAQGWEVPAGRSPIIPVVVGDERAALDLAAKLRARGHYAPAIRPPTVPAGACRLRLSATLAHKPSDRKRLLKAMAELRAG